MPNLSNWVPFEVTVKFKVIAAQEPGGPQSVGGLRTPIQSGLLGVLNRERFTHVNWTTSLLFHGSE